MQFVIDLWVPIWFGKPWKSYALHATDALVYGLLMGGMFGWLWPR